MFIIASVLMACSNDDDINNESNNRKFNFNTFETFKGQLLNINSLNTLKDSSKLEQNNFILSEVNDFYGTNIDYDESLKELTTSEEIFNWLEINSDFNQTDINILANFSSNLTTTTLDDAISILEEEISIENLDLHKVEKYQSIVNSVKLIEYQNKGFFTEERVGWGCAFALAKLALASASLVGASVGTLCYVAATSFIAASASVGMACGDD